MGAVPTQIETGDIPTAFATGRADAMITSLGLSLFATW